MQGIKPCPHCAGVAYLYSNYSYKCRTHFVYVKCEICGSQGKTYRSNTDPEKDDWMSTACESAVEAWNMRVPIE